MEKNADDPIQKQTEEIMDAILGPDADLLEKQNCEEFLLALGIDPRTLLSEFKEHLEARARHYQSQTGAVPNSIGSALRTIRDRVKSSNPMNVDPDSHIDLLLNRSIGPDAPGTFARAFRREGDDELCAEDLSLLDELEAELREEDQELSE
jgi:hypothetical protein